MNDFLSWFLSVTAFVLLANMTLMCLPDSLEKKYIRFFIGLLFLLVLIEPIAKLLSFETILNTYTASLQEIFDEKLHDRSEIDVENAMNTSILRAYETRLEQQITQLAYEEGYEIENLRVECQQDTSRSDYGAVSEVSGIIKARESKSDSIIEVVRIDPGSAEKVSRLVPASDFCLLLEKTYHLPKEVLKIQKEELDERN